MLVLSSLWYISVGLCPAGSSNASIGMFAVHAKWWMKKWTAPGFPGKVWTYKLLYDSLYVSIQGCSSYGVVCSPSCGKLSFYLILVWQNQTISHYKTQAFTNSESFFHNFPNADFQVQTLMSRKLSLFFWLKITFDPKASEKQCVCDFSMPHKSRHYEQILCELLK